MSDDSDDEVMKTDYMVKRSVMKSQIFSVDNFKARWFILSKKYLKYLDGSLEKGVGKEKGRVNLSTVKVIEEADLTLIDDSKQYGFQIWYEDMTKDKKSLKLYVSATSQQMKFDWIEKLREACANRKADFATKCHPGVWTQKDGQYSCCEQLNRDAPGCTFTTPSQQQQKGNTLKPTPQKPIIPPTKKSPVSGKREKKPQSPQPIRKPRTSSPPPEPRVHSNHNRPTPAARVELPPSRANDPPITNDLININISEPAPAAPVFPPPASELHKKKLVLVQFDYFSANPDDLNISKGEKLEIVDDQAEQFWWQAKNASGEVGFIPYNYVAEIQSSAVESHPWFFPDMSRQRAELLLKEDGREGVYLVRISHQANCYTVGIFTKEGRNDGGIVRHYHIKTNATGEYYLSDQHAQPSIPELIGYHSQNAGGLITRLRFHPHEKPAPPTVGLSHGKFLIDRKDLQFETQLGKGNFGEVWRAKYKGKTDVAVKMTLPNLVNDYEFVAEAKLMMQLQSEHLVQLYGVCEQPDLLIVTEYMEEGALLDYLKRKKSQLLRQPSTCLDIAKQICEGMAYLESRLFIHRDLAARNCLVGSGVYGYQVKVADFGLSRHVVDDEYTSSVGAKFPIRWSSPEVLLFTKFSSKSDVWAFGVLMWEVFTGGDTPYPDMHKNQQVAEYVSQRKKTLPCPQACPNSVYQNIMLRCWQYKESDRPKFSELVEYLSFNW